VEKGDEVVGRVVGASPSLGGDGGTVLGASVGANVGTFVGADVGTFVGTFVGADVRSLVGAAVPIGDDASVSVDDDDDDDDGAGDGDTVSTIGLVGGRGIKVAIPLPFPLSFPLLLAVPPCLFLADARAAPMVTRMAKNKINKRKRMISPLRVDVSRWQPICIRSGTVSSPFSLRILLARALSSTLEILGVFSLDKEKISLEAAQSEGGSCACDGGKSLERRDARNDDFGGGRGCGCGC
jgi:hypothetical protein